MAEHKYLKSDLITTFDGILGKTLEEVDNDGFFDRIRMYHRQKGVVGSLIEKCVLGYGPDSKQEPDLLVIDGENEIRTELKTTGIVVAESDGRFEAKEPMSITAVDVYGIANQVFETSHFWEKLEHMLIVYYQYMSDYPVDAYDYRAFPIKGYEFHEFTETEKEALRQDWERVRNLAEDIVSHHEGNHGKAWKKAVKEEYINRHGELRKYLNYINLAPKFPPRFRLKKPIVSSIISKHFGYELEQLPGKYTTLSDIDQKCHEIALQYGGKTIGELAEIFKISIGSNDKAVAESITVAMFGGASKKISQIEIFGKFGLIGKSIVISSKGEKTEDMKLFRVNFGEITRTMVEDDGGEVRAFLFEDSALYSYFTDYELLCIVFQEPELNNDDIALPQVHSLMQNRFIGFKRVIFSDEFIYGPVKRLWNDTRDKVMNEELVDVVQTDKEGKPVINKSGGVSSAPNFMKSRENDVFMRGSGTDSSIIHKTECVNGIRMLPQYVWLKGSAIVEELKSVDYI